jgi:3-hydroxyisobutyrate dehydrogenase
VGSLRGEGGSLATDGARLGSTPAEAAEGADVVLTMLSDGETVGAAMLGRDGALATLRTGSVWIQMATIGQEWTERLATIARVHRLEFVDAPVSGSDGPARDGQLVVLASGPDEVRARLEPIFDAIGRKTVWLGAAGDGTRLKLVLNNWIVSQVESVAETLALTEALGLDPGLFVETIGDGPLASPYAMDKARAMVDGEFTPGFTLRLAYKDIGLALDAARGQELERPVSLAMAVRWREAIADSRGDEDVRVVIAEAPDGATGP